MLTPTSELKFMTKVECITPSGIADVVRVIVVKGGQPLLVAIINMPPSEMTLFE